MTLRKMVFLWENLGPSHIDRLEAIAKAHVSDVVAIQYSARSHTYSWTGANGSDYETRTLFEGSRPSKLRFVVKLIRACLGEGRAVFFLCHYHEVEVFLTACILRLFGRRVFCMIDSKFDDYPRRLPKELLKSIFLWPYNGALTASLRSRDYLRFLGIRSDAIALGYDSIAVDRILQLSGEPVAPDGMPFAERDFVIVARHVPKKNINMGIEAFALWLRGTQNPRNLHLCGSGPLEGELRAQVEPLGIADRVLFHGFVQTEEVSRVVGRALALLLTSVEEQYGLVIAEALAVGVPVLCSVNAGASDMLVEPGLNGFLINPYKPEGCAAMMALLSEDEARWRSFATAAATTRYLGDSRHFVDGVRALADGRTKTGGSPPH